MGKKLVRGVNDLYTWCLNNGDFGQLILSEWTGYCDNNEHYEIINITRASHKNMLWHCCNNHNFHALICDRTKNKTHCPYCSKIKQSKQFTEERVLSGKNDLYTFCIKNGDFGKEIMNEWTGISIDGEKYKIDEICKGSTKKMKWKCKNEHIWYLSIVTRVYKRTHCPYCCGQRVCDENSLYNWCQSKGMFGQQLLSEWTGICDDGNQYEIDKITAHSNKNMQWICIKKHRWNTKICNRTKSNTSCPYCNKFSTSYPEQFLYRALKQIYPQTISRGKFQDIEYDITIPEERTCIEYSGATWHCDKLERDQMKADICRQYNMRFIQIYANNSDSDEQELFEENFVIYNRHYNRDLHDKKLVTILGQILKSFNRDISEIDIEKAQTEAFNFMHDIEENGTELSE